jgi:hypothetical protein
MYFAWWLINMKHHTTAQPFKAIARSVLTIVKKYAFITAKIKYNIDIK